MPIYEYYCPNCQGYFRHLAKQIDAPAPACPRCGNSVVERIISAVNTLHNSAYHAADLKQQANAVNSTNTAEIARLLKNSGRLEEAEGLYGSKAYRELVERRVHGATDSDLTDLVDDLAIEMRDSVSGEVSGATLFSNQVENRMLAEGLSIESHSQEEEKQENYKKNHSESARYRGDDLGWV